MAADFNTCTARFNILIFLRESTTVVANFKIIFSKRSVSSKMIMQSRRASRVPLGVVGSRAGESPITQSEWSC